MRISAYNSAIIELASQKILAVLQSADHVLSREMLAQVTGLSHGLCVVARQHLIDTGAIKRCGGGVNTVITIVSTGRVLESRKSDGKKCTRPNSLNPSDETAKWCQIAQGYRYEDRRVTRRLGHLPPRSDIHTGGGVASYG